MAAILRDAFDELREERGEKEDKEDDEERAGGRVEAPRVRCDALRDQLGKRGEDSEDARDDPDGAHDVLPPGVEPQRGAGEVVDGRGKEGHAGEAEAAEADGDAGLGGEEHRSERREPDRHEDDHRAEEHRHARGALPAEDDAGQHQQRRGNDQPREGLGGPEHVWEVV